MGENVSRGGGYDNAIAIARRVAAAAVIARRNAYDNERGDCACGKAILSRAGKRRQTLMAGKGLGALRFLQLQHNAGFAAGCVVGMQRAFLRRLVQGDVGVAHGLFGGVKVVCGDERARLSHFGLRAAAYGRVPIAPPNRYAG